jgi:hypothetical protein
MATISTKEEKRQRYLIVVLIAAILIIIVINFGGFFGQKEEPVLEESSKTYKKIELNFEVLKDPILKDFQPFEEIPPFEGAIGKGNPFLP